MKPVNRHSSLITHYSSLFFVTLVIIILALALLPGLGAVNRPWPGFFYSPFYTTNIFTDPSMPAYEAGLRPEDRVIQAGARPGQWLRINTLKEQTALAAELNRPVTLVYELGRDLAAIPVRVENSGWLRWLEKAGPLFLAGLVLSGLALFPQLLPFRLRVFAALCALPLLAAPDYFLNPGHGLESGFEPFSAGNWLLISSKWSTFLYAPLWKLAVGAGAFYALSLFGAKFSRLGRIGTALIVAGLAFDLISYAFEVWQTARWNNPDYVVWHGRSAFWLEWVGLSLLLLFAEFKRAGWKGLLPVAGFAFFLGGFIIPTVFDQMLPGPGPQWYCLGMILFFGLKIRSLQNKRNL